MRILYHAINGSGLGHLMRLSAVALGVRRRAPHVHQFIVTGANYPAHLRRLNMPFIVLPGDDSGPLTDTDRRAGTLSAELNARILRHVIREYDPGVVVFDTHAPRRIVMDTRTDGRQSILVFRRCRPEHIREGLQNEFFSSFDLILTPYSEEEFREGLPEDVLDELDALGTLRHCGGIVFPMELERKKIQAIAQRYGVLPGETLVLITAGSGGYDALNRKFLGTACQAAVSLREKRPGVKVFYVGGPYAKRFEVPDGCEYVESEADLQLLIARADLLVGHAGYNTIQEVLRTGARAALVPIYRRAEDQGALANRLAQRGRARVLDPDGSKSKYLKIYTELLDTPRPRRETINGAGTAADEILGLAEAPGNYICCRESDAMSSAVVCATTKQLALRLGRDGVKAVIRIDWDRVEELFGMLGASVHQRIAALEVDVGSGEVKDCERRIARVYGHLAAVGFDRKALVFSVNDSSGGDLLAALARRIHDLQFRALVARIPKQVLQVKSASVFQSLELCRRLRLQFKLDITVMEETYLSADQP